MPDTATSPAPPRVRSATPTPVLYVDGCASRGGAPLSLALTLGALRGVKPAVQTALPDPMADLFAAWETFRVPQWDTLTAERPANGSGRGDRGTLKLAAEAGWSWWHAILPYARRTAANARQCGARLIHCNNDVGWGLPAMLAARWLGIPCVVHQRGYQSDSRMVRALSRLATHHVAVSQSVADHLIAWGVARQKVTVIWNGVDPATVRPPRAPRADVVVGVVGRFVPWKGLDVALHAALRVAPELPHVTFRFVGGPSAEAPGWWDELRAAAAASPAAARIQFLGDRPDAWKLMREMDILLHTSVEPEPCARVLLEGLAAGCAVVSTRAGGSVELLAEDAGRLLPPGDVEALAAEVRRLAGDPAARRALQERAHARVRAQFDIARVARQVEEVYAACLVPA